MTLASDLAAAAAAIERGDARAAVTALVAAWVAYPAPEIAALAGRADRGRVAGALPKPIAAREAAWLALAAKRDPDALVTLLAADWPTFPREAKERLKRLVKFAPDPRIADAIVALWEAGRYRSTAGATFWNSAIDTLATWGDGRFAAWDTAQTLAKQPKRPPAPKLDARAKAAIRAVAAALDRGTPAAAVPVDRAALLAAVYADPDDDAARSVYADALVAEGEVRGEFIHLQLMADKTAKQIARERALLRAHGFAWLDGLRAWDERYLPTFRRGFVYEWNLQAAPKALEKRAFRTVAKLIGAGSLDGKQLVKVLAHDNAHVTSLESITFAQLAWLHARPYAFDRVVAHGELVDLPPRMTVRELAVDTDSREELTAWIARNRGGVARVGILHDALAMHDVEWIYEASATKSRKV